MKVGVLVMAHGTPSHPDDIEAFYTRIRRGSAPSPEQLGDLTRRYLAIGGTSPLSERTDAQVSALRDELERLAPGVYDVRFGSKFEPPLLEEAAASFRADGFSEVIGLVLAPHASTMSTGQYMNRASASLGDNVRFYPIDAWFDHAGFPELIGERVRGALASIPTTRHPTTEVIFSAHSLPERIVLEGDTYADQLNDSARLASDAAGLASYVVAFQSAGRTPDPWLGPDILVALRELRERGVTDVVSCPIGFVADHLEVLFDLDIEAQSVAGEIGLNLVRTASLNDDPDFVAVLADIVHDATLP